MTKQTDVQIIREALERSRSVLSAYIEPGPRDPEATVESPLAILDDNAVVHALDAFPITARYVS